MKTKRIVVLMLLMVVCMSMTAQNPVKTEEGVSLSLAKYRAAHISNVQYKLMMIIPENQDAEVKGTIGISFDWDGDDDLQVDFQGKLTNGNQCLVNGESHQLAVACEHIIIPHDYLKKGQNSIEASFVSNNKALNRNPNYLYSLFVPDHARSVFPCFDQPDLKARFLLTLQLPQHWRAISNAPVLSSEESAGDGRCLSFEETDPLPTYLFSFTAGRFEEQKVIRDGRELTVLYRETDPSKVAQLPEIFDEMALSLRWLEDYTGIRQPFKKYGCVVLPGYQFGGMEHPGCIQLRDKTIFLGQHPSPDERLNRLQLIAHETAHLWFGDMVTMRWFNDVWTKEVLANFMADKVCRQQFPELDHDLSFLRAHYIPAYATDRTKGTHPIQQPLDNLCRAGLLYGNIIYHKAPIMMRKLEERMGEAAFRQGLQVYLNTYAYGNATWDELIDILCNQAPDADLKAFDQQWVKHRGMETIDVALSDAHPLPNADGRAYARYRLKDSTAVMQYVDRWSELPTKESRLAAVMTLYENFLMHTISADGILPTLLQLIQNEHDEQLLSTYASYAISAMQQASAGYRPVVEQALWRQALQHPISSLRQRLLRSLGQTAVSKTVVNAIYRVWKAQSDPLLNTSDYMRMAYHLAMVRSQEWRQILNTQRLLLKNDDQRREFDFVSRACNPDTTVQQQLFESLLQKENRIVEPYALSMLSLLSSPLREPYNNKYILPALEALQEIQQTNDIFFPLDWCNALLGGHRSLEARQQVELFLQSHPSYPPALRGKLLQAAYPLLSIPNRLPKLDARHLLLDGSLSDAEVKGQEYVFNSLQEAVKHLSDTTTIYVKPWVYWVDDPDNPEVVIGKDGREPFGMVITTKKLSMIGLCDDARDVVFASMRGQMQGAVGNFTMFDFHIDELLVENMTLGNYCNVDLDYTRRPELERKKRSSAITQAHVGYVHGNRLTAKNVRFISRLNLNPLNGARESLYEDCHFECTDDALNGSAVYRHCDFDLYGQKPFWSTFGAGPLFVNCDFHVKGENREMYFCKQGGPLTLIDCRYHASSDSIYIGWTAYPQSWLRCYQKNFTFNGNPYRIGGRQPENTIVMDSVGMSTERPPHLRISRHEAEMQVGGKPLALHVDGNGRKVVWRTGSLLYPDKITGDSVTLRLACDDIDEPVSIPVTACTVGNDPAVAVCMVTIKPPLLPAPTFLKEPSISIKNGVAHLDYQLDLQGRRDVTRIVWGRLDSDNCWQEKILTDSNEEPLLQYRLRRGDIGRRLIVTMRPMHSWSEKGAMTQVVSKQIKAKNVKAANALETDFSDIHCGTSSGLVADSWQADGYKPSDTGEYHWTFDPKRPMWEYGEGFNGAVGRGLLQAQRGARLMYTPYEQPYGDMSLTLEVDPTKTAGQGFGSATGQYMDICLKFDTQTLTGYGLRIIRTAKYAKAVDFYLVEYRQGEIRPISEAVSATCYRTGCTIRLAYADGLLKAHVETKTPRPAESDLPHEVDLQAEVAGNSFGGIHIQHTGTCGESTTMLHRLKVLWF